MPPKFIDVKAAAKLLCVQVSTIYAWIYQRKIPYRKHGRKPVFLEGELFEWSSKQAVQPRDSLSITMGLSCKSLYNRSKKSSLKTEKATVDLTLKKGG